MKEDKSSTKIEATQNVARREIANNEESLKKQTIASFDHCRN